MCKLPNFQTLAQLSITDHSLISNDNKHFGNYVAYNFLFAHKSLMGYLRILIQPGNKAFQSFIMQLGLE